MSVFFPFSCERYGLLVTHECKKDLGTQTVQFDRTERNISLLFFAEMYLSVAFPYYRKDLRKVQM